MSHRIGEYSERDVLELAGAAYRTGAASFSLDADRAALLVIDMQREFVEPAYCAAWVPAATRIVPLLARVIAAARRRGVPVIYTAFAGPYGTRDRPRAGAAMPNRYPGEPADGLFEQALIVPGLEPAPGEIILLKPSYGAFYDTPLDTMLRVLEKDTIIVTGTLTNLCCGTTARQGYERSYRVVFGADVTATNHAAVHEAEVMTMRYGFARVLTGAEIIAWLEARGT